MLNARNGRLKLKTGEMDYIRFGTGEKTLVMIPGVGDGLKTVKGILGSQLYMYQGLGHGLYEEAPDFLNRVKDFGK